MTTDASAGSRTVKRRPKDRKQQIADNAAVLFAGRGFHNVRMEDIARASGITDRALYRHYENKQSLLAHVVALGQEAYERALPEIDADSDVAPELLPDLLHDLSAAALDTRELAVLWAREARYLPAEELTTTRRRVTGTATKIVERLGALLPGLSRPAAELRGRAVLGLLASPGHHQLSVARGEFETLLEAACMACCDAPSVGRLDTVDLAAIEPKVQMSARREQLLSAAAAAFRRSGYVAVGIEDIGRPLGIVGPALYRYFPTKLDILVNLSRRLDEWLTLETLRALRSSREPRAVVRALVAAYVRVAIEDPDLVAVSVTESLQLPKEVAAVLQRAENDRLAEWLHRLRTVRPELSEIQANLLIRAVVGLIQDTVRIPHLLALTELNRELVEIGVAVLMNTEVSL